MLRSISQQKLESRIKGIHQEMYVSGREFYVSERGQRSSQESSPCRIFDIFILHGDVFIYTKEFGCTPLDFDERIEDTTGSVVFSLE
jgi:hypothetical protein